MRSQRRGDALAPNRRNGAISLLRQPRQKGVARTPNRRGVATLRENLPRGNFSQIA